MALTLGRSIRYNSPGLPTAVITDADPTVFENVFDLVVAFRKDLGPVFRQKLCILDYSPFEQTLFIDSDCMVFRSLDWVFNEFQQLPVLLEGDMMTEGDWYGDVATRCNKLGVRSLPRFNSGVMLLRRTPQCQRLMSKAVECWDNAIQWNIPITHSSVPDEPVLSMAMAYNGVVAVRFTQQLQAAPWITDFKGLEQDVLRGRCTVKRISGDVKPSICHYLIGSTNWIWTYRSDAYALSMFYVYKHSVLISRILARISCIVETIDSIIKNINSRLKRKFMY